jgi:hypothetical protein
MQTTKYTFWKLVNEYRIEIPIIQRDYAQGRNVDKIPELRKDFLDSLYNAISHDSRSIDFDFVYGSVETGQDIKKLLPLDGQQRLTTLFLLYWYLATKDNKSSEIKGVLSRFGYETRISSRDFCYSLVENGIIIDPNNDKVNISDLIKDAYWFYMSWEKDPTIKAMLTMLDDIHLTFRDTKGGFEKLKRDIDSNPPVTFRFLELENFGLTDNLYIKMNARGKPLTDFENFKAKFTQTVKDILPMRLLDFTVNIDTSWTDIFWKYKEVDTIDNPFMRYIYFITEMLYIESQSILPTTNPFLYNENSVTRINYELIKIVFSTKENVEFLMNSFDFWLKIPENPDEFMNSIFSEKYEADKLVIFDGKYNLWNRCLTGDSFGIAEKILLYSLIKRGIGLNTYSISKDLVDYLRVIRNLLLRVRQSSNVKYNSNLRFDFMKRQLKDISDLLIKDINVYRILVEDGFIMPGFAKDSVDSEINKAKIIEGNTTKKEMINELEDDQLLKGCIDNLLEIIKENPTLDIHSCMSEIWSNESSLISKALLSFGDYSITIGYSQLGPRKYFGGDGDWNIIITRTTNESDKIKKILKRFISTYASTHGTSSKDKLQTIINEYLLNARKDWRYYFIKYEKFIENRKNIYAWRNEYELRSLNGFTLQSYHCNPYERTLVWKIDDKSVCDINACYSINSDLSALRLKNAISLENLKDGWKIKFPDNYVSKNNNKELIDLIKISNSITEYWLKETTAKDRIEVAIDFVNSLK